MQLSNVHIHQLTVTSSRNTGSVQVCNAHLIQRVRMAGVLRDVWRAAWRWCLLRLLYLLHSAVG